MRGSPLLRVLLVVIGLLLVSLPLRSLTSHSPEKPSSTGQPETEIQSNVHVVLTSTTFPFTFEISHLGKTIWKGDALEGSVARDVQMSFPPEGIDLLVDAKWQDQKQTAVRLDVTPEGSDTITKTLWGTAQVSDVLTFAKP
jgi:hypothetical protein